MITPHKIADLKLSAASGLVRVGSRLYVVADDEQLLDTYQIADGCLCGRVDLGLGEELPAEHRERKRLKPDLECLTLLPDRRLLALGSGSSPRRQRAVLLQLGEGDLPHSPRPVDLAPLYRELGRRFDELNIEGVAAAGDMLRLLQRGNGRQGQNAIIDLDLQASLAALGRGRLDAELIRAVWPVQLDDLDGVPLGLTDGCALAPGSARLAFVAAAEDTDDPYEDGPCAGSVLGVLDAQGAVQWSEPVEGRYKLEGLALGADGLVLMVADPDDRSRPAPLLQATVARLVARS